MPTIHITIADTPDGGVSVHHDFTPRIGAPCSPAQSAALEIISRTTHDWGVSSAPVARKVVTITRRPTSPEFSEASHDHRA